MANPPKVERNKKIVKYRQKQKLSYGEIGKILGIGKQTVYDIYLRESKRKELSTGQGLRVRS